MCLGHLSNWTIRPVTKQGSALVAANPRSVALCTRNQPGFGEFAASSSGLSVGGETAIRAPAHFVRDTYSPRAAARAAELSELAVSVLAADALLAKPDVEDHSEHRVKAAPASGAKEHGSVRRAPR